MSPNLPRVLVVGRLLFLTSSTTADTILIPIPYVTPSNAVLVNAIPNRPKSYLLTLHSFKPVWSLIMFLRAAKIMLAMIAFGM